MWDSSVQGSTIETGSSSATYADHSTPTEGKLQSIKAEGLVRSTANNCFPEVTGEQYNALKKDIEKNGQYYPILVHGDEVIDGWTRYRICAELGIEVKTLEVSDHDGVRATLSSQFSRGVFSKFQKAMIIREVVGAAGRGRPKKGSKIDPFLDELAKEYQISKSYFKLVDRVQREWEDALEDIRLGKITAGRVNAHFKKPPKKPVVTSADGEPTAWETPPDQAATVVDDGVDEDSAPVLKPEASEMLKVIRRILGGLSETEKSQFRNLIEPVCDFLDIDLN